MAPSLVIDYQVMKIASKNNEYFATGNIGPIEVNLCVVIIPQRDVLY